MRSSRLLGIGLALLCMIGVGDLATAQWHSKLDSHEHFILTFIDPLGATVQLKETDAYKVKDTTYGYYPGKLWKIKVPGTSPEREVWVKAYTNYSKDRFFMSYCHPDGIAPGWRVESLEQQFHIRSRPRRSSRSPSSTAPRSTRRSTWS
jgi:hypothetical protein